ncbi:interferon-induced very large GTPase 1-like isoform X3 [Erpetoichthys calabaricus]|uniref:interferon-induced very large GTPase 1-like isoform X3 n=1 Tax=Erpetoichthys calabaricus TaxID=27687 RepID=UPI0022348A38|nr:interferon-induced very large GTPase 1-like isoform X3 [Erpetoichthys calabaricus]
MCSQGSDSEAFIPFDSSGLLSDYNILEMCADGLALQSVLLSCNPEDLVKKRSAMIDVTRKCKWSLLNIVEPVEISASFTSHCQEQSARVLLENGGYSTYQELINIVDKNTILEVDRQDGHVHDRKVEESHPPYMCEWKKYLTPVATCTFSWTDLLLCPSVIADLKKLENTKCQQDNDTLCKDILEKYGSHVSTSNTFGGIYGVKVESTKFSEEFRETRRLLKEIVDEVDFSTDTSAFQEQFNHLNNGELAENSTLSLQILGGPDHFLALEDWRKGLQSASSTWKVIDRGPLDQYVPVWRIISLNHKNDFIHYEAVSDMIKRYWEKETGVQDTSSDLEKLMTCEDLVQSLIENAEIWSRLSEDQFTEKCVEFLTEFTKVHFQLWMNQSDETDLYWRQNVICHNTIQDFLMRLVSCLDSKDFPSLLKVALFEQIQNLVEKYIFSNPTSFSCLNTILSYINRYVTIEEGKQFSTYDDENRLISRIKKQVLYITPTNELITEMLLYNVLVALIRLKQILAKTDEGHLQYLITAIFYENLKSEVPLKTDVCVRKWKSMTDKILKLEHHIKELRGMSKEEGQASVFIIALEDKELLDNSKKEAESVIQTLMEDMGSELCASLEQLIEKYTGNSAELKDELNLIRKQSITQTELMKCKLCEIGELVCHDVSKQPEHKGHSVNTNEVLETLGLEEYCNEKLSMRHIKKISSQTIQSNKPSELQEVPWCFIQKLMMVHSGALKLKCLESQCAKKHKGQLEDEENEDDWLLSDDTEDTLVLNPLDVIVAVFMCSDHFVRQELVQKMSMCQISVPFLLPNFNGSSYILQWALRAIRKKWYQILEGNKISVIEKDIVTHQMLAVTFIRLGDLQRSKSAFLNSLLCGSQGHHNFYIHSEMEGGDVSRKISSGLVELSWYLPQEKENEGRLLEPMVVMNLRGDAKSLSTQVGFLSEVSSMIFVFVDDIGEKEENVIATLSKSKSNFFLLLNITSNKTEAVTKRLKHLKSICEITRDNVLVRGKKNNEEFVSAVWSAICKAERRYVTLEGMSGACRKMGFYIDEDYPPCKTGRENADKVLSDLNPDKIVELKEKIFPFQGLHWHEFSRIDKEYQRLKNTGKKTPLEYAKGLEQKKKELRQKQLENELSPAIKMFIEALLGSTNDERLFFLHWMKFKLDSISLTILPKIQEKLVTQITGTHEKEQLLNRLSRSSMGLEHFLREIGQIYEASFYCSDPDLKKHLTKLPSAAADMLLSGFPVELIDGDVSNIPIRWVSDVLKQVQIKTHPDTRIFVLSVLGLQSTGKSTLLNTLFGLQFAVSAGRCTRGAFMQLICVDQHMKAELGCDYIMVIDTEGLRSEELLRVTNNYEHDNELATLITGLSDIVLVNLSSESNSEIQDILQIIVHALIRMKEVGIKRSIYFIHHNVSDLSANVLNLSGVTQLLKQLDILTQMAAKQENKEETYTKFSDVIHYDIKKTMKYMPGLWHSPPPMASVSSRYSEKVFELKQELVEHIKQQRKKRLPLTISDFITLMEDFSNAVKSEDFIFSFQNSLAAVAYSKLSSEYSKWKWEIQKSFTEWKEEAERRIKNCDEIDNLVPALKNEADEFTRKQELKGLEKLQDYFTSDVNNRELIESHKHHFEVNIKTLCLECKGNAERKCEEFIKLHQSLIDFQKLIHKYGEEIEQKVNELVQKCKLEESELTEIQLKEEFEKMWEKNVKSFKMPADHVNIRADMENALMADESKRKDIKEKLRESHLSQMEYKYFIATDKHVNTKSSYLYNSWELTKQTVSDIKGKAHSWWNKNTTEMVASNADKEIGSMRFEGGLQEKDIQRTVSKEGHHVNKSWRSNAHVMKVQKTADSLISKCNKYLADLIDKTTDYDQSYCTGVIKEIDKQIKKLGEGNKLVNSQFHVDIKLHICGTAVYHFQEMHDKFMREHNVVDKLQESKDAYWETFSEMYHERDLSKKVTNQFYNLCLKPSLIDEIQKQLSRRILKQMRQTWAPVVLENITNFQLSLLVSLHDGEDFEAYKAYITDNDWFAEEWLAAQAEEFCRSKLNGKTQFSLLLEEIISSLSEKLMKILDTKEVKEVNTGKELLHMLMKEMEKIMVLKKENLGNIMFKNMGDASHLIENLCEAIQVLQKEVIEEANKWDPSSKVRRLPNPPHKEMMSFLKGCGKKCPFCGTPCELEGNDHQHYSSYHRVLTIENKAQHHHLSSRTRLQKFNFVFWRKAHQKTVNCIFHKVPMKGYEVHNLLNDNWGQLYKDYTSIYWQFVYKKYYKEFAQWHKHEPVRIRVNITKHDVKTHLEKVYQVHLDDLKIHESKTTISRVISKWKEMKVTTKNEKL